jgi:cell division inhibitor SepF
MGLKNFWNKMVGTVSGKEDEYEDDPDNPYETEEYEQEPAPRREIAPARPTTSIGGGQSDKPIKMMIVEPETFDDSQSIADFLRERKPVVINFESTEQDIAKRVVDFVSGATYALDGNIQKVGKDIFLCVPSNVKVENNKRDYNDFTAALSWKAPTEQ